MLYYSILYYLQHVATNVANYMILDTMRHA